MKCNISIPNYNLIPSLNNSNNTINFNSSILLLISNLTSTLKLKLTTSISNLIKINILLNKELNNNSRKLWKLLQINIKQI